MSERRLLIMGIGAQAKYAAEICGLLDITLVGALANEPKGLETYADIPILGSVSDFEAIWKGHGKPDVLLCAADATVKARLASIADRTEASYATLIHPAAVVAANAEIGPGCIINPCATVQPLAVVGKHCMLHSHSDVEHDCEVGDYVNLAPGALLAGHVRVGRGTRVYAHASVLPTINVGTNAVVGAGAVVREDVPDNATVVGVPARLVKGDGA